MAERRALDPYAIVRIPSDREPVTPCWQEIGKSLQGALWCLAVPSHMAENCQIGVHGYRHPWIMPDAQPRGRYIDL
ncbi:hypothetical protein B2G71_22350 [Novosphingobium sp. PC22D]|nr:hypothetical protein B2G71_22350 [Novosphingobium sp. PC22D]